MTKCIIIGREQNIKKSKPIEFVKVLYNDMNNLDFNLPMTKPKEWENLELIRDSQTSNEYDIIYAYNNLRNYGSLYLGHWNDGYVEE